MTKAETIFVSELTQRALETNTEVTRFLSAKQATWLQSSGQDNSGAAGLRTRNYSNRVKIGRNYFRWNLIGYALRVRFIAAE